MPARVILLFRPLVMGMYLLAASEVPELSAKYLILPGQAMLRLPYRLRYHHSSCILL